MLYVGNFSYTDASDELDNYCIMPAVVDAPDAEAALERFSELLRNLHDNSQLLAGADHIYLDSLVELAEIPTEAMLIQWQKVMDSDDGLYSVVSALPGNEDFAEAYSWDDEGDEDEDLDDEDGEDLDDELNDEDEISPDELADAITAALDMLAAGDLSILEAMDDSELDSDEEAFISFV